MAEFMIMNFDDSVVPDEAWARTLPAGTNAFIVDAKSDSGNDTFSIATGQGRNGTNALRVTCNQVNRPNVGLSDNLPGFWVKKINVGKGGTINNPKSDAGYFVPRGMRANRLHAWFKFPAGYRVNNAAALMSGGQSYRNFVVGTYHYDPGKIDGSDYVVESDNFHFYYQITFRHDVAGEDWIHMVVSEMPTHQRSLSQFAPPPNITRPMGSIWETLTRLYLDSDIYYTTPEISYPYDILVDSIYTSYEEEDPDITIQIENFGEGQDFVYTLGSTHNLTVTVSNSSGSAIAGRIYLRSRYSVKPKLLSGSTNINNTVVTIPANSSQTYTLQISTDPPTTSTPNPLVVRCGVAFARNSDNTTVISGVQPNITDPNVVVSRNIYSTYSPIDGRISGAFIRTVGYHTTPALPSRPWSKGGVYYEGPLNSVITGTLPGGSAAGLPVTFSRVSQQSSGGNITIAQDGAFTFTPAAGFEGAFFFRYKLNDGSQDSLNYGSWIYATSGAPPTPPPPEPPAVQAKIFLANGKTLLSPGGKPLGY